MAIRSQPAPAGYCAAPGWSVSATTGTGIAGAVLNVHRWRAGERFRPGAGGDLDGRAFPSLEAANAAAVQAGYTLPFRREHATWKASHRYLGRDWARIYVGQVRGAGSHADLVRAADAAKAYAMRAGVPVLDASRYFGAVFTIARRLRPELFEETAAAA